MNICHNKFFILIIGLMTSQTMVHAMLRRVLIRRTMPQATATTACMTLIPKISIPSTKRDMYAETPDRNPSNSQRVRWIKSVFPGAAAGVVIGATAYACSTREHEHEDLIVKNYLDNTGCWQLLDVNNTVLISCPKPDSSWSSSRNDFESAIRHSPLHNSFTGFLHVHLCPFPDYLDVVFIRKLFPNISSIRICIPELTNLNSLYALPNLKKIYLQNGAFFSDETISAWLMYEFPGWAITKVDKTSREIEITKQY